MGGGFTASGMPVPPEKVQQVPDYAEQGMGLASFHQVQQGTETTILNNADQGVGAPQNEVLTQTGYSHDPYGGPAFMSIGDTNGMTPPEPNMAQSSGRPMVTPPSQYPSTRGHDPTGHDRYLVNAHSIQSIHFNPVVFPTSRNSHPTPTMLGSTMWENGNFQTQFSQNGHPRSSQGSNGFWVKIGNGYGYPQTHPDSPQDPRAGGGGRGGTPSKPR